MSADPYEKYRQAFVSAIARALNQEPAAIHAQVKDAEPEHGDLAFPTFGLAKAQKKAPPVIAKELATALNDAGCESLGLHVAALGPYVNARYNPALFARDTLLAVQVAGMSYGHNSIGQQRCVVIDYSSPNIAKPIAFHHIRSTVIGQALANIYRSQGYRVEGINYLGDWGKQFGLVAAGFSHFGDPEKKNDMGHLVSVYVQANARAENDPAFDEEARNFFRKMEASDPQALALWQELREVSVREFQKVYARLGVAFNQYEGESRYQDKMDAVITQVQNSVGTKESDGALIVDMPYADNEPPVLLRKNDGSTLYATRDLAAAIDRYERFAFESSLYVVATDQSLHFRQVFAVLERMGLPWAKQCVHVNFGRVHGMSTRKGSVVLLTDVLDEAKARALEKVKENEAAGRVSSLQPDILAEQIGLGAIVFGDLKNRRTADYTFNWDDLLSFEGHTGPYVQYAHARACKVLRKAEKLSHDGDATLLLLAEEQALIKAIAKFPATVREAQVHNEPSAIAKHLLDVAAAFARYYTLGNQHKDKRILVEGDAKLLAARLALVDATRLTLASGLQLLGVPAPEGM